MLTKSDTCSRQCSSRGAFIGNATIAAALAVAMPRVRADGAVATGAGVGPQTALSRLVAGNRIFVKEMSGTRTQTIAERVALGTGQAPWASILTCADSRVAPEIVFNVGLGDIFVSRVAGNIVDPTETASLEYGAAVLGSQLIVVMGHSSCGAVKSAVEAAHGKKMPSADIEQLVGSIVPAVRRVSGRPGNELVNATKANVLAGVARLSANAILSGLRAQGKLKVVGAYYDLTTGSVSLLS